MKSYACVARLVQAWPVLLTIFVYIYVNCCFIQMYLCLPVWFVCICVVLLMRESIELRTIGNGNECCSRVKVVKEEIHMAFLSCYLSLSFNRFATRSHSGILWAFVPGEI